MLQPKKPLDLSGAKAILSEERKPLDLSGAQAILKKKDSTGPVLEEESETDIGSSDGVESNMKTFTGLNDQDLKNLKSAETSLPKINKKLKTALDTNKTNLKRKSDLEKELQQVKVTPDNQEEITQKTDELSKLTQQQQSFKEEAGKRKIEKRNYSKIGALTDHLATGSSQLGADIAAIPELVYDIFSAPQNAVGDIFNLPEIKTNSEEFKKYTGINNTVKDYYKQEVADLKQKAQDTDLKYQGGIYDSFVQGDYGAGFDQLTNSFAESLPATTSIMVGGAAMKAPQLIAASSMMFGAGKNEQLKDENPDMNENTRVANALATGLIQGATESLGTGSIGAAAKGLVEREGAAKATTILKDGLAKYYKEALKKNPLLASMSGEGLEEAFQGVAENVVDVATGAKPADYNVYGSMADDFIGGAFGGAIFGAGLKGLQQVTNYQDKNQIKANTKKVFNLQNELQNPDLSPASKKEITKTIDGLIGVNRKLVQKNVGHVEALPPKVREELLKSIDITESTQEKAREIKLDPNTSDETKQILLDNLQKEYKAANDRKTKILEGSATEIDVLPLKEQDKLKREALKELTQELNPDGKKNITITNEEITKRANKNYSNQIQDEIKSETITAGTTETKPQAEVQEPTDETKEKEVVSTEKGTLENNKYTLKNGEEYEIKIFDGINGEVGSFDDRKNKDRLSFSVHNDKGESVANITFWQDKDGKFYSNNTNVNKNYQRKGIATAVYNYAEQLGIDIKPSVTQTKMGESFFNTREKRKTDPNYTPEDIVKEENFDFKTGESTVVLEDKPNKDEATPTTNTTANGNIQSGVEPVDEVRVTEQENIVEEPVSEVVEPRASEAEVEVTEEPEATALKNADIAVKRKELGLEERETVTRKKSDELVDAATKKINEGYDVDGLIEDILDSKTDRTLTDEDVITLKQYQLAKENRLIELGEEIVSATNEGVRSSKLEKLINERESIVDDIDKAYRAGERSGTITARALQARKLAMLQDYSLANMLIQKTKSVGIGKLTPEQIQETATEYSKIKKLKEQLEAKVLDLEKQNADLKAGKNIEGLNREERRSKRKVKIEEIDADIDTTVASLRKKLREQAGRLSANAIPIEMIPDIAKLAQLYVKKGVVKLDDIVDGIYTSLKEDIQNLSKDDIKEIIGDYDYDLEAKNEKRLDSFKKRTVDKINELKDKLTKQDFSKKQNQPVILDEEAKKLKDELRNAKYDWEKALEKDILKRRTVLEKTRDGVAEVLSLPRSVMASIDFSAPLRQGLVLTVSNPIIASKAFVEMFRQAVSQNRFDRWLEDLKETPQYEVMKDSGLYIADTHSAKLSAKEEQFMSNLANKIPIIGKGFEATVGGKKVKVGGLDLIGGSERAYVSYLNKLRTDVFAKTADVFEKNGLSLDNSPKLYKALGNYINSATGRGNLGSIEESSAILNSLFFSPRLIASRVNLLTNWANPVWYANTPPKIRQMYALDMAKLVGVGVTLLTLASLGGADVEEDPRSSDFGKIKSGNTRWDIWGGFQQFARFFAQMTSGQRKSTTTKQIKDLDGTGFNSETRADVFLNMIRSKLAPVPGTAWNLASGKTMVGEEYTLKDVPSSFLPLFASDLYKAIERDGATKGVLETGIPAVFGVGVQNYSEKASGGSGKKYNPEKSESEEKEDTEKSSEK